MATTGAMAAIIGTTIVGASGLASASSTPAVARIQGSTVPFTSHAQVTGTVAGGQKLSVQVWLRPRVAAAERLASAVSTPGSTSFRHYLSPAGYAARFGTPAGQAAKVESWLRSAGFTGVRVSPLRSYVRATGRASVIDAAFRTTLRLYRATSSVNAGPYQLRANSKPISVPAGLASIVQGVTGLDNAAPIIPLDRENAKTVGHSSAGVRPAKAATAPWY